MSTRLVWTILISSAFFVATVALLTFFGYEVSRDSQFKTDCKDAGGVYFLSKHNEEYCATSEFLFNPTGVDKQKPNP